MFVQPPEFQLEPLPKSNPILEGVRWKQYHAALGPTLKDIPKESWDTVKKEKAADMTHVLDFPYNGEPPKASTSILIPLMVFICAYGGHSRDD